MSGGVLADIGDGSPTDDRQFITALARGLQVLRAFDPAAGPLGNGEIAALVGLPKPTISRMTYTLARLGYLEFQPRQQKYVLGPGVLTLGFAFLDGLVIRQAARTHLRALAEAVDASAAVAIRDHFDMVYVDVARGPSIMTLRLDTGSRLPLHRSGVGAAFLLGLPPAERAYIETSLARRFPDEQAATAERLARAEQQVREHGFCTALGLFERGWNSVACHWAAPQEKGYFAFNVAGPASEFPESRLIAEVGPRLLKAVSAVERDWARLMQ